MIKLPFETKAITFTPEQEAEIERRIAAAISRSAPIIVNVSTGTVSREVALASRRRVR